MLTAYLLLCGSFLQPYKALLPKYLLWGPGPSMHLSVLSEAGAGVRAEVVGGSAGSLASATPLVEAVFSEGRCSVRAALSEDSVQASLTG